MNVFDEEADAWILSISLMEREGCLLSALRGVHCLVMWRGALMTGECSVKQERMSNIQV